MTQPNLFAGKQQQADTDAEAELRAELRRVAKDRGIGWPTIYFAALSTFAGAVTAQVWLNGRACCIINRRDLQTAAQDLWTQAGG